MLSVGRVFHVHRNAGPGIVVERRPKDDPLSIVKDMGEVVWFMRRRRWGRG